MSLNNFRKYDDTTYLVTDDPSIKRINIKDHQRDVIFEFTFIENQLSLYATFCRSSADSKRFKGNSLCLRICFYSVFDLFEMLSGHFILGTVGTQNIDPNLSKSLAG